MKNLPFVVLALASCGAPRAPSELPPAEASTPAAETGAASTEAVPHAAGPDPMWRAIVARRVYSRVGSGAESRCVALALEPEAPPGGYTGDVVLADPPVRLRYEGQAPVLSLPRLKVEEGEIPLPCDEGGSAAWFVDEERCLDGSSAPDLAPSGCGAGDPQVLAAIATGANRAALLDRVAQGVWLGADCFEHVAKKTRTQATPHAESAEVIALYPKGSGYPLHLLAEGAAGLVLREVAADNPYQPPAKPGGGEIAIGCCLDPRHFHVLEVADTHATLIRHPPTRPDPTRAGEARFVRWYFSAQACKAAKAASSP